MNYLWFDKPVLSLVEGLTTNGEGVPPSPFALSLSKGPNTTFFKQNRYKRVSQTLAPSTVFIDPEEFIKPVSSKSPSVPLCKEGYRGIFLKDDCSYRGWL